MSKDQLFLWNIKRILNFQFLQLFWMSFVSYNKIIPKTRPAKGRFKTAYNVNTESDKLMFESVSVQGPKGFYKVVNLRYRASTFWGKQTPLQRGAIGGGCSCLLKFSETRTNGRWVPGRVHENSILEFNVLAANAGGSSRYPLF